MVVVAGLPFLKLGVLFLKQLAKPLSARLRIEASKSPKLAKYLQKIGQFTHSISSRMAVFASGYKFLGVKPIPDDEALKGGIDFCSEAFVVVTGAIVIIYEYDKSARKEQIKSQKALAKEAEDKRQLHEKFANIEKQLSTLQIAVNDLENKVQKSNASDKLKKNDKKWYIW